MARRALAVALGLALLSSCTDDHEPVRSQLIFDGQSLVTSPENGVAYPELLEAILPREWYPDPVVAAVAGSSYEQRAADAGDRVDAVVSDDVQSVLIDVAGQAELGGGATTADALLDIVEGYAQARRDGGVDVYVIATVPPSLAFSPAVETQRLIYNDLLRESKAFDAVVDLARIPEAQDTRDTRWYVDGTHPTSALAALFAVEVEHALDELGLPTR